MGLVSAAVAAKRMDKLLMHMVLKLPQAHVLLASIPGCTLEYGGQAHKLFNNLLRMLVDKFQAREQHVSFVDMASECGIGQYCDPQRCSHDMIHPNAVGYKAMADVWYKYLKPLGNKI